MSAKHTCQPGDGCPRSVIGPDGHSYRIERVGDQRWSMHDLTGEWGRGGKDGPDKALKKPANPPLVGYFPSWAEAVAAVHS